MDTNMLVRRATEADIPLAAKLAVQLVGLHHQWDPRRFIVSEGIEDGYARWFTQERSNANSVILVAVDRQLDEVIGYAYGRLEAKNWNMLLDVHGALHDIFVVSHGRKGGVGKLLVQAMHNELLALGAKRVVLHTASANVAGQKLFAAMGYRPTMVEMTWDPEPAVERVS